MLYGQSLQETPASTSRSMNLHVCCLVRILITAKTLSHQPTTSFHGRDGREVSSLPQCNVKGVRPIPNQVLTPEIAQTHSYLLWSECSSSQLLPESSRSECSSSQLPPESSGSECLPSELVPELPIKFCIWFSRAPPACVFNLLQISPSIQTLLNFFLGTAMETTLLFWYRFSVLVRYFHGCDKMPGKHLKEGRVILVPEFSASWCGGHGTCSSQEQKALRLAATGGLCFPLCFCLGQWFLSLPEAIRPLIQFLMLWGPQP